MNSEFKILLPIAIGGALGAIARYFASLWIHGIAGTGFPYGTLLVNVAGSFAIGILYVVIIESSTGLAHYRAPLMIGLLGAFTTYSTFSLETMHLVENGELTKAGLNIVLNVILCLAACWLGLVLGRLHSAV
jgi:CrcB protein